MTENSKSKKPVYKTFIMNRKWHSRVIGFFVGMLMIAIYLWMAFGFVDLLLNLYHYFPNNWSHGSETVIKDIVTILALLEVIRVFKTYLSMGRIKVTFILDVALVVLIGELISLWYRDYDIIEVFMSIFVITALVLLRIITSKYSPE